jgi:hypothetical protein
MWYLWIHNNPKNPDNAMFPGAAHFAWLGPVSLYAKAWQDYWIVAH